MPGRKWTEEQRRALSEKTKAQAPWLAATGPRTAAGKGRSARNAYKHGLDTVAIDELRAALRAQEKFLNHVMALLAGGTKTPLQ